MPPIPGIDRCVVVNRLGRIDRLKLFLDRRRAVADWPFPEPEIFHLGPEEYIAFIRKAKKSVGIPVIASLNAATPGTWTAYAKRMEEAGADALELNIYYVPTSPDVPGTEVEKTYVDILKSVKSSVTIPVAVKLAPFFSNMAHFAKQLEKGGADGLVLFNRFYQPSKSDHKD